MKPPIDRASGEDLTSLATDVGPTPMQVGAVLMLGTDIDPAAMITAVEERIRAVPRLRQRLVMTRFGCGRPIWTDDAAFDIGHHVTSIRCAGRGDEEELLALAAGIVGTRLDRDRPLWSLTQISGLDAGRAALVVVFHHVLADGIGGLAVLANLVDGSPITPEGEFPRPAPTDRQLAFDAWRDRLSAIRSLPATFRRAVDAIRQLRPAARTKATPSSLNRPTGAQRRFMVVRVDLDALHQRARSHGATVNDVVLTAVAGALHRLLRSRGETVDRFVVSVPVSARRQTNATHLGNQVGVIPIELPGTGDRLDRLAEVAATTHAARASAPAASSALLGPAFRLLARLGIFQWFIDRQRLVHTFVTNLHGPDVQLSFLGAPIVDVVPAAVLTGNVTASFAVLSYAGTLDVVVIADPEVCPDQSVLRDALQDELGGLIGAQPPG